MQSLAAAVTLLTNARRPNIGTCWEFCDCHAADRDEAARRISARTRRKRVR